MVDCARAIPRRNLSNHQSPATIPNITRPMASVVRFEIIRGTLAGWPELMERAAAFASGLGRDRLISISHSEDHDDGVIAVWYWGDDESPT